MSEILNKNLRLLEKYQPSIFKKAEAYLKNAYSPLNTSIDRIILARQEEIVLNLLISAKEKEYLICDHEDPIGQAYGWIDQFIDPSNKAEIVFGMGFGYHIEVLHTSFKGKKIILIEPNMELFVQILKIRNLENIIKNTILFVDEGINNVMRSIYSLYWDTSKGGIQCQPFGVYEALFPEVWNELKEKFIKQAQSFNVDVVTRKMSGELWIRNNIQNLQAIGKASDATGLIGKFKGKPGILVSAGPSLQKNIALIKELKDQCVIVAVGTAVNILEKDGITPHFMVAIDGWDEEAEIHKKVKDQGIYFIYSNQVAPGSLEAYQGPKFLMNYTVDLYTKEFLKSSGMNSFQFLSGPSVSNTCFDLLYKFGCNPIILTGQDLAYTEGSHYAGDLPGSEINEKTEMSNENYILAKDIFGQDIFTSMAFLAMKNSFEGYFERVKDQVEIINATEGGINIDHTRNSTLKRLIETYDFKAFDIEGIIQEAYEKSTFPEDIMLKLQTYKDSIHFEIKKLEDYCGEQMKLVNAIKTGVYHPRKNKNVFDQKVAKITEFSDTIMESTIYNSLLQNLLEIDFYLIKVELDRATKELTSYEAVKDIYIRAITNQNEILLEKLNKIKEYLS